MCQSREFIRFASSEPAAGSVTDVAAVVWGASSASAVVWPSCIECNGPFFVGDTAVHWLDDGATIGYSHMKCFTDRCGRGSPDYNKFRAMKD